VNILYQLEKMEEVLRQAPLHNTPNGLHIQIPSDTADLWRTVINEILAVLRDPSAERRGREGVDVIAACQDCGLPYSEFGLDTTLPNLQWSLVQKEGDEGLLCANCIVKRASHLPGIIAARMVLEIVPGEKPT